ncbi:MAG: stage II sporulation protein R [Clostridia bacterium]|nr:stage II sporulation protein R [Clostridia bacterium]
MKQIFIIFLFVCLSFFDAYVYAQNVSEELFNNVIRLHVIADDDSENSQSVKLKVRDAVLQKIKDEELLTYNATCEYVEKHIGELEECVYETLREVGAEYDVLIKFEECEFPTKNYDNLSFPKGRYRALRILLGDAKGKNWWCVMYPTLCFTNEVCEDSEACKKLRTEVSAETFDIVAGEAKFKFKILEFFAK